MNLIAKPVVLTAAAARSGLGPDLVSMRMAMLAERRALGDVLSEMGASDIPTHLFKPFTGHSLGASGALDAAILHEFMIHDELPPNLPGLAGACGQIRLPSRAEPLDGRTVLKISVGMGGHNALIALKASPPP